MTLQDFDVEGRIGDGSFSQVLQARVALRHPSTRAHLIENSHAHAPDPEGSMTLFFINSAAQQGEPRVCTW